MITFIGAGPNDPELLTIKAFKVLQNADIIIAPEVEYDDIIQYLNAEDKRIHLKWNEFDKQIQIMVDNRDKEVVRLYAGDPSLFSSMYVLMNAARYYDISFEIIPGVTSAFYAASIMNFEYTALLKNSRSLLLTSYCSNPEFKKQIQGKPNLIIYEPSEDYCMKELSDDLSEVYGEDTICFVFHDKKNGYRDYDQIIRKIQVKDLFDYNIAEFGYNSMIIISHSYDKCQEVINPIILNKIVRGI